MADRPKASEPLARARANNKRYVSTLVSAARKPAGPGGAQVPDRPTLTLLEVLEYVAGQPDGNALLSENGRKALERERRKAGLAGHTREDLARETNELPTARDPFVND